jgi:hypothetical protein
MRDLLSNIQLKRVISPVTGASSDAAQVGAIIDRQGYDSLGFLIATGTIADAGATFAVLVEHGDVSNLSDAAAVPDSDLIAQDPTSATAPEAQAAFTEASDDQVRKIGYIGSKRYVRLTVTPTGNAAGWGIGAVAVLANAEQKHVVQAAA